MKRNLMLTVAAVGLAAIGIATAQQQTNRQRARATGDFGDGQGGRVGQREDGARHRPGRRHHRPPCGGPLLGAIDANHDGVISADEIANASAALATLDANGDGELTRDEFCPRPPMPPPPGDGGTVDWVAVLMRHDHNGDGLLTPLEMLPPPLARLFDEGDTNGDGALDAAEITALGDLHLPPPPPPPPGGPGGPGGPGDPGAPNRP